MITCPLGFPGSPSSIKITRVRNGARLSWDPVSPIDGEILDYSVYLAVRHEFVNNIHLLYYDLSKNIVF